MTADTTTAPDRIWAWDDSGKLGRDKSWAACFAGDRSTEYIRADLCRAPVAQDAEPVAWPSGFFELSGDARLRECATDGCYQCCSIRMERGGVGSDYCESCARKIAAPQPSDEVATLRAQLAEAEKRADQAERRERALLSTSEYARKHLRERDSLIARAEAAEAERDRFRADVDAVKRHIPMDYLIRHDVPGATGPTEKLDLGSAMRDYAEDRWSLIERYKTAKAALAAAEDHADVLAEALHHMVNASVHPDQMADEALAAHQARRAGE